MVLHSHLVFKGAILQEYLFSCDQQEPSGGQSIAALSCCDGSIQEGLAIIVLRFVLPLASRQGPVW